jgi:RNA polymerase sigma-70 factor (ECF subfamily)
MSEFHRQLEQLIPKLRQYAFVLTRDGERADDLVQSSLVRALEKRALWRPGTDLRAWLFTIMHNQFITEVRRANASPVRTLPDVAAWQIACPAAQEDRLMLRDLRRALATLPPDYRSVLLMAGLEDIDYTDTARILQVPIGTIKSRLSRARGMLRARMRDAGLPAAA